MNEIEFVMSTCHRQQPLIAWKTFISARFHVIYICLCVYPKNFVDINRDFYNSNTQCDKNEGKRREFFVYAQQQSVVSSAFGIIVQFFENKLCDSFIVFTCTNSIVEYNPSISIPNNNTTSNNKLESNRKLLNVHNSSRQLVQKPIPNTL